MVQPNGSAFVGRAKGDSTMSGKRELIDTGTDKRYVRRDEEGKFEESVDVGRSLSQDRKRDAENESKPGYGDQGDRED
jgi:hypothetical protein